MTRRSFLSMFAYAPLLARSRPQDRAWQKGEVAAIDILRIPVTRKRMGYRYTYTVHAAGHTYVFDDRAKLNLTVNGSVEYSVEGDKIFIRDEGGKEHKETILQKALDTPGH